jgi:hypothetical protein
MRKPQVEWWSLVWFSKAIPRHSFLLWLALRDSLVTGERMAAWGYGGNVNCVFCRSCFFNVVLVIGFGRKYWRLVLLRI